MIPTWHAFGKTEAEVRVLLNERSARVTCTCTYVRDGTRLYDVVMIANGM